MKIKTQNPKMANTRVPVRTKINKKRLFFIFFSTFAAFFFICTLIASLVTPSLNVPALNDKDNLTTVTSDDFKGRLDPRLKSIEMQEDIAPATATASSSNDQAANQNQTQGADISTQQEDNLNGDNYQQSSEQDYGQLPYDSRDSDYQDSDYSQPSPESQPKPERPVQQPAKPEADQDDSNLILRDKVKVERNDNSTTKVMVGTYSSPSEARKASQDLTSSNLNVTPFIKENNGVYSLQVGSFSNSRKAEGLASELKKRNYTVRISQD